MRRWLTTLVALFANLVIAVPQAAAVQGSTAYQRIIHCAALAKLGAGMATEAETNGFVLKYNGFRAQFASHQTYDQLATLWIDQAASMGEFDLRTTQLNWADELEFLAMKLQRSSNQRRDSYYILADLEECRRDPPNPRR